LCLTENTVSTIMIRRITERGVHAKCLLISPILTGIEIMRQCLVDIPDVDLHKNPSRESLVVPCGQTNLTGRRDEGSSHFFLQIFFTNA
jgi:hypothetical protein